MRGAGGGGRRRPWPLLAATALLLTGLIAPTIAVADPRSSAELEGDVADAAERREHLEEELAAASGDVAAAERVLAGIRARLDDAQARLRVAEGQVELATAALRDAEAERDEAADIHEDAEELLDELDKELAVEADAFEDQVVHTFKFGSAGATRGAMVVEAMRGVNDPSGFAVVLRELQVVIEQQDEVVANVADLRARRDSGAEDAARTRGLAMQTSLDAADTLEMVEELRDIAAGVAAEIEDEERRERELLASLELTEAETAALVERATARESELEDELAAARERERREAEARRRAAEERRRVEEQRRQAEDAEARRGAEGRRRAAAREAAAAGASGGPPIEGMVCPVVGTVTGRDFSNDWGYPRAGGRTHQGNDIFADRGTPIVAVDDGEVVRTDPASAPTRLGGITVTYETADGSEWYNAHLDAIADDIDVGSTLERGQPIGTVGNTGNARTTPPHLHLGRRIDGGWVNPWPTVGEVCR